MQTDFARYASAMDLSRIVITGANGTLGKLVVAQLLRRVPAGQLALSVRDPAQAADLAAQGVRVRRGDYSEPDTLAAAFEGASRVLLVSSNTAGDQAVRDHRAALAAAAAAGAAHVYYTSHVGAAPDSPFPPMPDHAATEAAARELLAASGAGFTALRNGFYASTVPMLLTGALVTGELAAPADGPVAWTAHADLAEATAQLLLADAPPARIDLTGGEALDLDAVAAIASEVHGKPIRRVVISDAAYRDALVSRGVPAWRADLLVGMFVASRRGDFARIDPALARMLGRPPTALRDVLRPPA